MIKYGNKRCNICCGDAFLYFRVGVSIVSPIWRNGSGDRPGGGDINWNDSTFVFKYECSVEAGRKGYRRKRAVYTSKPAKRGGGSEGKGRYCGEKL